MTLLLSPFLSGSVLLHAQLEKQRELEKISDEKDKRLLRTIVGLKDRYGKNAVLKGMNFMDGATTIERNGQVGGHKAE